MSDHLELPDELQHLIEKREAERRSQSAVASTVDPPELPAGEDRRKTVRRADDRAQGNNAEQA